MFSIASNSNKIAYGTINYIVDTIADIEKLPTNIAVGSEAFVTANSTKYILNNQKQWVKVITSTSGGGGELPTDSVLDGGLITR